MWSLMEKTFMMNQLNGSYDYIRKATTGQLEGYTAGCLLDYDYIKNHHRLTAVDLSRQEELDTDSKAIEQVEFAGQLKE